MDDLEPVAPLDAFGGASEVIDTGRPRQGGARRPALYVPPYLYPDAFPSTASDRCRCEAPKREELTKEDRLWASEVSKQLGLPLAQVMEPRDFRGVAHCRLGLVGLRQPRPVAGRGGRKRGDVESGERGDVEGEGEETAGPASLGWLS
ncbi:unnamed protein product [Durusdinium trenchii]|uniref:Uncharacterized protein n=1 Tax=Durusdinium trenchii TaxID=1381693 RepID=A0ABP0KCS9_9DINO